MAWCNAPGVQQALPASAAVRSIPTRPVRLRLFALGLVALSLGACDFPTEPPIFESRFVLPAEETSLSINELLPSTVAVSGNEFTLALNPVNFSRTFGQMCPACVPFNGMQVPKPAFTDNFNFTIALPADVQSAVLAGGSVTVQLSHSFGFDILRPAGSTTNGSVVINVKSGATVIGTRTISSAFPSGTTLTEQVTLNANATVTNPLTVEISLNSPAGGLANPVTINTNAALNITASPGGVRISQATVAVPSAPVDVEQVELDLDIDDTMAERVEAGTLVLRITNPFAVGGTMTMTFTGAAVAPKTITLTACTAATPCTTTQRINFTKAEIQSMLGNPVTMRIAGVLTPGFFTVRPNQTITIDSDLDLTLRIGGSTD